VAARAANRDDDASGHVLAAVVAGALDDSVDAGVPDAEPFPGPAAEESLATRRAVEGDVADQDVLLRHERRPARGEHDNLAAREPLAAIVLRVALENERHSMRHERAEALAGGAVELHADRILRQPFRPKLTCDLTAEDRADRATDI